MNVGNLQIFPFQEFVGITASGSETVRRFTLIVGSGPNKTEDATEKERSVMNNRDTCVITVNMSNKIFTNFFTTF